MIIICNIYQHLQTRATNPNVSEICAAAVPMSIHYILYNVLYTTYTKTQHNKQNAFFESPELTNFSTEKIHKQTLYIHIEFMLFEWECEFASETNNPRTNGKCYDFSMHTRTN